MGITSLHEHIQLPGDPRLREKSMEFAISELNKAKDLGLSTIVEVSPTRDAAGIREISNATGIQVICCTGSYVLSDEQQSMTVRDFENHMRREVEEGFDGTAIFPGVIKVAARSTPLTTAEMNLFTAAAHIQQQYSLPICTHAVSGCADQQRVLEKGGADLNHCYYSHVEASMGWEGRSVEEEADYLESVISHGSTLSFNNFGNWNHTRPDDLAYIIRELAGRGYEDHMVATMDLTWSFEGERLKILWEDTNENGDQRTYAYLLEQAVPWMKENGVPEQVVRKMIRDTPRRIFTYD